MARPIISNLLIGSMQLTKQQSRIVPRRGHRQDKYEGQVHTQSKLRHGLGHYQFDNTFFKYEGQYVQGRKQGKGRLIMQDGTVIEGSFVDDQLVGTAQITYSHGAIYRGDLLLGEKEGRGLFESQFEYYQGDWKQNKKHGTGTYRNKSTNEEYVGQFQLNKYHGKGKLSSWNYFYEGEFQGGKKEGEAREICDWGQQGEEGIGRYEYNGRFKQDKFQGIGEFRSKQSKYIYKGEFLKALPVLYPNEFRLWLSTNTRSGEELSQGEKALLGQAQPLEYQLQGDSLNLYIETVYQGPEVLDQIQPTQQQIDALIKNWQNQNKKNKNPPPMPDFTQPRMKKPEVVKINQQSGRTITLRLIKEADGKEEQFKIDYRAEIAAKRKENEELRLQALKKAEEDAGKKGGKKDNKQPQLKVNIYKEKPSKRQTNLHILTQEGSSELKVFELPDDFPAGKYWLQITSPFKDFGKIHPLRKEFTVKSKLPVKKK